MPDSFRKPLLSIGLPVCNGENFIAEAIQSILNQTFSDFELIISDNASTDATPSICRKFAQRDSRIRYCSNSENIGAAANFRKVFYEGKGKYFKWAAHDDMLDRYYLERCISALEEDSESVLCHSQVALINESGRITGYDLCDPVPLQSQNTGERFRTLIHTDLDNYEVFGVIRRNVLARTGLIADHIASDRTLRAELGLHGRFIILPEPLFLCRDHPARSIRAMPSHQKRGQWFAPKRYGWISFPHWRILAEYFKCISRVERLSSREKFSCRLSVLSWIGLHANWARLLTDPLLMLFPGLERPFIRLGRILTDKEQHR